MHFPAPGLTILLRVSSIGPPALPEAEDSPPSHVQQGLSSTA